MLDFNTKKKILKRLSDCAEKHFIMLIPCLIAAGFVKLFYFIACNIDIALSDKEGNFLGIKRQSREKAPKKRKDDIVYVKRSFWSRAVSLVLTFAFVGMFVPAVMPAISVWALWDNPDYQQGENNGWYDVNTPELPTPRITSYVISNESIKLTFEYDALLTSLPTNGDNNTNGSFYAIDVVYILGGTETAVKAADVPTSKLGASFTFELKTTNNRILSSTQPYTIGVRLAQAYNYSKTEPSSNSDLTQKDHRYYYAYVGGSADSKVVLSDPLIIPEYTLTYDYPTGITSGKKYINIHLRDTTPDKIEYANDNSKSCNVDGYIIYKSVNDGNYKPIAVVSPTTEFESPGVSLLYTDTDVQDTTKYKYIVCAYSNINANTNSVGLNYVSETNPRMIGYLTTPIPTGNTYGSAEELYTIYTDTSIPQNVSAVSKDTYVEVSWSSVENATSYIISRRSRSIEEGSSWSEWEEIYEYPVYSEETKCVYKDNNILNYTEYEYVIYAVNKNNNNQRSEGSKAAAVKVETSISAPLSFDGTPGSRSVTLNWICYDPDVYGFDVIMQKVGVNEAGEEYVIDTTAFDEWTAESTKTASLSGGGARYARTIEGLTDDQIYKFYIRSYKMVGGKHMPVSKYVPDDNLVNGLRIVIGEPVAAPTEIYAEPADQQIKVTWSAVKNADGYRLYIARKTSSGYVSEGSVDIMSGTEYIHKGLKNGDTYRYYVVSLKKVLNSYKYKESEDKSREVTATVGEPLKRPTNLTITQVGNNLKITWNKVDGADGYELYICTEGKPYADMKDITSEEYIQLNPEYGVTYTYYVVAYKDLRLTDGTYQRYRSKPSDEESFTIGGSIAFPSGLKATPYDGRIELSWTAVPDAAGYVVYATCDGRTETFNVSGTTFSHTGLTAGKTYTYYVVAYKFINNTAVYSVPSNTVSATVGSPISAPTDFTVTAGESSATLKWTAPKGSKAEGYTVYGISADGQRLEIDVSKTTYTHTGLMSGDVWTYYVRAYKTINNQRVYSDPTNSITVKIGALLAAPTDLVATSGNRQVALKWTKVKNAEGYIVYVYDEETANFLPISIVSKPTYTHTGLKNGKKYTYMVAAYKMINGERVIGDYSLSVSAIPTAGNAADVDFIINVKGTVPYGISHSELISAAANHEAFDEPVDAYFSVNDESTRAIKEVLRGYANGLKSFIIYPFDITLYLENTLIEVEPNEGFNVTFTIPVPDQMIGYRDYITVVHLKTDGTDTIIDDSDDDIFISSTELEVLPSAIIDVNGVWCVQFTTDSCSPFAFVIYRDNLDDVSSGGASSAGGASAGNFNTGVLLFTALPDIMPSEKKTKFVVATKKRYRIKK